MIYRTVPPFVSAEQKETCLECGHRALHTRKRGCTQIVARPVTGNLCRCDGTITALNDVQRAIIDGVQDGLELQEIAQKLGYSASNIHMTLMRLREKWKVRSNLQLIAILIRTGII